MAQQQVAAVRRRLLDLLGALDAGSAQSATLAAALAACQQDFAALQALGTPADASDAAGQRRWRAELESLMRLNAVCIGRVEAEVEALAQALLAARQQRDGLEHLRTPAQPGGACDVSG